MRVLVTGTSGFVGSHTVKALLDAGHEVRASARSAERVRGALEPLGCADAVEVAEADTADEGAVRDALDGCEAVVHAAALFTFDARRNDEMLSANVRGAELVLSRACEQGLDPVVHVSSLVALLPATGTLTPDSPVGRPGTPYALSKARSEEVARRLQAEGAPVTITWPGAVWGPDDPNLGETASFASDILGGRIPFGLPGTMPVVDVRDVAAAHAAALRPDAGARRYVVASELVPATELMRIVAEAGGRRAPRGTMPAPVVLGVGRLADGVQRLVPPRLPVHHEGPWTMVNMRPFDASATVRDLGIELRPASESLVDTVRWLRGRSDAGAELDS